MANRSKSRSGLKQSSTKTKTKPCGFWQTLYQQITKLRLHLAFLAALGIFAIGMLFGVTFSIYYNDGSNAVARVEAQIPPSEEYEGPVEIPKKVAQGTAVLEPEFPSAKALDGQSETVRNQQTAKSQPPQEAPKEGVLASMKSQKEVPESGLITRKLIGNTVEAEIPPSEQYEGLVKVSKKVTQGTAVLEPDIPLAEAADGQAETLREKSAVMPKPAKNSHENAALKSINPQKSIPGPKPSSTKASTTAWLRFAAVTPAQNGQPAIAIVMDDLGIDQRRTDIAIDLPAPITLAFIPYGYRLSTHTRRARENGHELLVHLPMEPLNANADPGKNALLKGLTDKQLRSRIEWNLSRFQGFVGVNNHMGSKFTAWERGMKLVVKSLKDRGLIFLDSKTTKNSVGLRMAKALNVPNAARDVFLDNEISIKSIQRQLKVLERVASKNGSAIGIGHPHDATVEVLRGWIPNAKKRGFILVPVSAIIKRKLLSG